MTTTLSTLDSEPMAGVLQRLYERVQDRLPPGALLIADNADSPDLTPYLDHVRDPLNGYTSVNLPGKTNDSVELSCRT